MMEVDSQLEISMELGYITQKQYIRLEEQMDGIGKQLSSLRAKYNER
jgi:four helix bundle protein